MAGTARCASRGCRQVFGLVDVEGAGPPPSPSLPGRASQCNDGFVSTYRCGAVPDSHRLPFSSEGASRRNRRPQHSVVTDIRQHDMWSFMVLPTRYPLTGIRSTTFHASSVRVAGRGTPAGRTLSLLAADMSVRRQRSSHHPLRQSEGVGLRARWSLSLGPDAL